MKKTILFVLVILCLTFNVYADEPSQWAAEEVSGAISEGFVPEEIQRGYTQNITREQFAIISVAHIAKELGYTDEEFKEYVLEKTEEVTFSDCENESVLLAARCGIVKGMGDGTFMPEESITREQAAAMLYRTYSCYSVSQNIAAKMEFDDNEMISDWAFTEIQFCIANGIMKGVSDTHFAPQEYYTIEQAIATFYRLGKLVDWEEDTMMAPFSKKMTMDEAYFKFFEPDWRQCSQSYETPYGRVCYWVTAGIPHSPSYNLDLVSTNGRIYSLDEGVPRLPGFGAKPEHHGIYLKDNKVTFVIKFDFPIIDVDGITKLYDEGTYYYEADLEKRETVLVDFIPPIPEGTGKEVRDIAVKALVAQAGTEIIENIVTNDYGTLLYTKSETVFGNVRYGLVLVGNDGKYNWLDNPPILNRYGATPPIYDITLSEYGSKVSFKRDYRAEDFDTGAYSASPDTPKTGVYSVTTNLITLEKIAQFD